MYEQHQAEIALIITDIVMPKMGGRDMIDALCMQNPNLSVIVMSGYPLADAGENELPLNFDAYLEKPLNLERLIQTVGTF